MPVSLAQAVNVATPAGTGTALFHLGSAPTPGHRLIFALMWQDSVGNIVAAGNGWTGPLNSGQDIPAGTASVMFWTKICTSTSDQTSTVFTDATTGNPVEISIELIGMSVIGAVRTGQTTKHGVTAQTSDTLTLPGATTFSDGFVMHIVGTLNSMGALVSGPSAGWTNIATGASNTCWAAYKILTATETSSDTFTWTTSRGIASQIYEFYGGSDDGPWPLITPS